VMTSWLLLLVVALGWWTWLDVGHYRWFKALSDSRARRATYLRWAADAIVVYGGAGLVTLAVLGELDTLRSMPQPFAEAAARWLPTSDGQARAALFGVACGGVVSIVLVLRSRRLPVVGDVGALIPRGAAERLAAVPLCVVAGIVEELFFRLALPLLILRVTGSMAIALCGSLCAFGLVHAYQGWKGVLITMAVGGLLASVYWSSGSLPRVMLGHALTNLLGMVVRPAVSDWLAARAGRAAAMP
jgi:CAAX protease family protein